MFVLFVVLWLFYVCVRVCVCVVWWQGCVGGESDCRGGEEADV